MAVEIHPMRVAGPWFDGYALDVHTTSSDYIGDNAYGHPEFATTRSPMGELLYRLKFRGDQTTVEPIVETVAAFLASWNIQIDAIVPVPPSNASRKNQPVIELPKLSARALDYRCVNHAFARLRGLPSSRMFSTVISETNCWQAHLELTTRKRRLNDCSYSMIFTAPGRPPVPSLVC